MAWAVVTAAIVSAGATAAIAWLTVALLRANRRYVKVSEAMQKPHVTVKSEPRDPLDAAGQKPYVIRVAQAEFVRLVNVGMGPALNVWYEFQQLDLQEGQASPDRSGFTNYIGPAAETQTLVPWTALENHKFELSLEYRSLSRRKYRAKIHIEGTVIKPRLRGAPKW